MMNVIQDVPVQLLQASDLSSLVEPSLPPDPDVNIYLPPLKVVRNVIDKMKNISDYLTITADMAHRLSFMIENDSVKVSTFYQNLQHPQIGGATVIYDSEL